MRCFLLLFTVLTVLTSCKKVEYPGPCRLIRYQVLDLIIEYNYDNLDRLATRTDTAGNLQDSLVYDDNGNLYRKYHYSNGGGYKGYYEYSYVGGNIVKMQDYLYDRNDEYDAGEREEYVYDGDDLVQCNKYRNDTETTPYSYIKYVYDNGNIFSVTKFSGDSIKEFSTYEYDNKYNPFYDFPDIIGNSKNNVTKIVTIFFHRSNSSAPVETKTYSIEIEYNNEGFPIRREQSSGILSIVSDLYYTCDE